MRLSFAVATVKQAVSELQKSNHCLLSVPAAHGRYGHGKLALYICEGSIRLINLLQKLYFVCCECGKVWQ